LKSIFDDRLVNLTFEDAYRLRLLHRPRSGDVIGDFGVRADCI
jgi:hypothetical protein